VSETRSRKETLAMTDRIRPITMPKWGLAMSEGKLTAWLKQPGDTIVTGDELMEVETDKITNVVEATEAGTLRRTVAAAGETYPVKALLGVMAEADVPDAEIDSFVASYVVPAAETDEETTEPAYHFVDLPFGTLRYAKRGEGEPAVLLIHGFGGDLDNWLFNIDALAEGATVYALDLPGHGRSVKALAEPTPAWLGRAVLAFMDAVGLRTAHLVGHSMGGAIALRMALDAPDRVASLTLIAPAGLGSAVNRAYVEGFAAAGSRRELKPVVEMLFADPSLVSRKLVDDLLQYKRTDGVAACLRALAGMLLDDGALAELPLAARDKLRVPTLLIWGAEDRVVPVAPADAPGADMRREVIDGAGHMVQMEAAGRLNALIRDWLQQAR
jgi:pyruvate dehydrogenase E2 component (dihydrolipoamide acetyltransferase)